MSHVVKRGNGPLKMRAKLRQSLKRLLLCNVAHLLPSWFQAAVLSRWRGFLAHRIPQPAGAGTRFSAALAVVRDPELARRANALFDPAWYCARYAFRGSPSDALLHYVLIGDRIGLQPHPWFDAAYFRQRYALRRLRDSALARFTVDWQRAPQGHPLFDPEWYLSTYVDVAAEHACALVHYVEHGLVEGRQPNAFFVPAWYADRNADVVASGLPPALHFCLYGASELRDPGPDFNASRYHARHPVRTLPRGRQLDPLAHYLAFGRDAGAVLDGQALSVEALCEHRVRGDANPSRTIDVVIPVYRGLAETRACIESVLGARNVARMRLRLHNDASPEAEVTQYLRWIAATDPTIDLVENAANLGFVGTVNDAMRRAMAEPDFDAVVLLNSDTEVANDWLDRIGAHASAGVATVTALSNNATICSFPKFGENALPTGFGTADVDMLAAVANSGLSVEVPTGVGFCMLITRHALERVGLFDQEAFGRGYGEENDFCMRASAAGLSNLLAMDVFVRHVGEVSFADVSKPGKVIAERIIRERYPDYASRVAAFCARDAGLAARLRLVFALWRHSGRPVHAVITHALGGGTERHVQDVVQRLQSDGAVVVLRPGSGNPARLRIENIAEFDSFQVELEGLTAERFATLLLTMGVTTAHVHHVLGHDEYVREGLARAGIPFDFYVHDYYSICPQVTLSTAQDRYCGEPAARGCDACIAARPSHGAIDIRNWRHANEWLVLGAREVIAPSIDCSRRIERHFAVAPRVAYHEKDAVGVWRARPRKARTTGGVFRVLVLGTLAPHKGRETVLQVAEAAQRRGLPLAIHLIGDIQGDVPAGAIGRVTWSGKYEDAQLSGLIDAADADAILFAAPIPETYSYTLSAAMRAGLPIVATDIGALPERLQHYGDYLLVSPDISGEQLADALCRFLEPQFQEGRGQ